MKKTCELCLMAAHLQTGCDITSVLFIHNHYVPGSQKLKRQSISYEEKT